MLRSNYREVDDSNRIFVLSLHKRGPNSANEPRLWMRRCREPDHLSTLSDKKAFKSGMWGGLLDEAAASLSALQAEVTEGAARREVEGRMRW